MLIRWDAWLTLNVFQHVTRPWQRGDTSRIPIIMYHSVSEASSGHASPYFETNVTPDRFARHMRYLVEHGYRTITMSEAVATMSSRNRTLHPRVAITFDDGYHDFLEAAWPILREARMTATVFLPTGLINHPRHVLEGRACLAWDEVRHLAGLGIEFGSHTVNHPRLIELTSGQIAVELAESRRRIEREIGMPCRGFSYPYAFPTTDTRFRAVLRQAQINAGYEWGVTTIVGTADSSCDRHAYPRLPVNEHDSTMLLEAKLNGAYNWMRYLQDGLKTAKRLAGWANLRKG